MICTIFSSLFHPTHWLLTSSLERTSIEEQEIKKRKKERNEMHRKLFHCGPLHIKLKKVKINWKYHPDRSVVNTKKQNIVTPQISLLICSYFLLARPPLSIQQRRYSKYLLTFWCALMMRLISKGTKLVMLITQCKESNE